MSIQTMWNTLKAAGLSDAGSAAVLGNLKAESLLKSNNLQDTGNAKLGLSDEEFTARVDDGRITRNMIESYGKSGIGYGLAQWTYYTRLTGLYDAAKREGVSIADEAMQIRFLLSELEAYPQLLWALKNSNDVDGLSDRVCSEFEKPAENNFVLRRRYAQNIFENHCDASEPANKVSPVADTTVTVGLPMLKQGSKGDAVKALQTLLYMYGYQLECDGDFGKLTNEAVVAFQAGHGLDADGWVGKLTWSALIGG